ncbi:MAG: hypothetical protein LLF76_00290 [Planctomycetaceae bacterium]|nr:hypothetical protein [Planctomycetaceae bacterium]
MSNEQLIMFAASPEPAAHTGQVLDELKPLSEIYQGHPVLSRDVTRTMIENCPIEDLRKLCRRLNVNVEGLMEQLEQGGMI